MVQRDSLRFKNRSPRQGGKDDTPACIPAPFCPRRMAARPCGRPARGCPPPAATVEQHQLDRRPSGLAQQSNWLYRAQGTILVPAVIELGGYGKPPSAPPLDEMLEAWRTITAAADLYLDAPPPPKCNRTGS